MTKSKAKEAMASEIGCRKGGGNTNTNTPTAPYAQTHAATYSP